MKAKDRTEQARHIARIFEFDLVEHHTDFLRGTPSAASVSMVLTVSICCFFSLTAGTTK
ncbi:hypothetical protein BRPE64_ECDS02220 (plasmid) [Caballeronia insecticola]|uniref:Uncharacterized protein n=1 Tax=Caballeronia insecticola TaxID=758793 RepID=A0A060PR15_9BURK|nr:hypothetical protein BRPE64_ECDS02220 [Caballeronia insecticola]